MSKYPISGADLGIYEAIAPVQPGDVQTATTCACPRCGGACGRAATSTALVDGVALCELCGCRAAAEEAWWSWHDASSSRWSASFEEAESRCCAWVSGLGGNNDGPER